MKPIHYVQCLVGVAIAAVLLLALGVSSSTLGFLAVALACPLMMVIMMRAMVAGHTNHPRDESAHDTHRQ